MKTERKKKKKRLIRVFQRRAFICQVWVSWLINTVLSWMEWGNCHLDSMSDSEKAQLVGLVEGAPWQSYTNSILSFSCFFFFSLGLSFTSLLVFGALSAHSLSTINTTDNLSTIFMKLKTDGEWEICSFVQDKPGHEDNMTFLRTWKILKEHFSQEQ